MGSKILMQPRKLVLSRTPEVSIPQPPGSLSLPEKRASGTKILKVDGDCKAKSPVHPPGGRMLRLELHPPASAPHMERGALLAWGDVPL